MAFGLGKKVKSYFKIDLKKQYRKERSNSKNLPISFHNWWFGTPDLKAQPELISLLKDDWFSLFLSKRLNLSGPEHKFNFVSVFGKRGIVSCLKQDKVPLVFYSGENLLPSNLFDYFVEYEDHCLQEADLVLDFPYFDYPNYLRFPYWLFRYPADSTIQSVQQKLDISQQKRLQDKESFCSLVSSHDKNGLRTRLFNLLGQIDHVDAGGKLLRNTDKLQTQFANDKNAFLENYHFNICPENSNADGYTTEKVFDAIYAGTLPIYWGDNNRPEPEVINHDAILLYSESGSDEAFVARVAELYHNKKLYQEFMAQEVFLPTAAEFILDSFNALEVKLKALLKNT